MEILSAFEIMQSIQEIKFEIRTLDSEFLRYKLQKKPISHTSGDNWQASSIRNKLPT